MDKPDNNNNLLRTPAQTPKGIVDPQAAARQLRLASYLPDAALAPFIDYFWIVEWDRRGQPLQTQRVLPYPNAHLVFEAGCSAIHGVVRGAYDKQLAGHGRVLGVRFKVGGLRPLISQPLASFADRTIAADALLGMPAAQAELLVLQQSGDRAMVDCAQALLLPRLPPVDPDSLLAARLCAAIEAHGGPVSVGQLCEQAGLHERRLQRLFASYVGASPKWVIQRYRLQEALWRLAQDNAPELSALAQELGFFDQAHFSRHFTELVGKTPLEYRRSQRPAQACDTA